MNRLNVHHLAQWIIAVAALTVLTVTPNLMAADCFATGDVDGVGDPLSISDFVNLVRFVSCFGDAPPTLYEADLNGDCAVDHLDIEVFECYFEFGMDCFAEYPVPTCCDPDTIRGACFDADGFCQIRVEGNCSAIGQTYIGDNELCDTDGDALPDCWELGGYDYDDDGSVDVNLPSMGADHLRKDVFVEIDWMGFSDNHHHEPKVAALNTVIAAFAAAPVDNPDGSTGIDLHIDYNQGGVFTGGNVIPHVDQLQMDPWDEFYDIKAVNFDPAREKIFHYCVFAHRFGPFTYSGISKGIPAADFLVTLGGFTGGTGTEEHQAGTFMHELGHNLGLKHGGYNHANDKPNYLSVMNYHFQMPGVIVNGVAGNYDYSRFLLPDLDETCLDEPGGLNAPAQYDDYGSRRYCTDTDDPKTVKFINDPIDWNCDNDESDQCVNGDVNSESGASILKGHDDWSNLRFDGGSIGAAALASNSAGSAPRGDSLECITWERYSRTCIRRGDADASWNIDIDDAVYLISYIFSGGNPPPTTPNGDPNASGTIDIDDVVYLINYIFASGPEPECF